MLCDMLTLCSLENIPLCDFVVKFISFSILIYSFSTADRGPEIGDRVYLLLISLIVFIASSLDDLTFSVAVKIPFGRHELSNLTT